MAQTLDNRPWAPHPIPKWVIKEFIRRQNDIGLDYIQNVTWGDKGDGKGTWKDYKGPMVPWVRFFSNGTGVSVNSPIGIPRDGFVMFQGEGFEKSYGITDNKGILGYDSNGKPHTLDVSNDGNTVSFPSATLKKISDKRVVQKFLPPPGIVSVDAVLQKERIRKITVNWKCYGFAQLEYLTPYFLTPKISAFIEFGWNHFNPTSLLDLRTTNLNNLNELFTEKGFLLYNENIRNSYGLYDVTMGVVSGFDFSTQDGFTYDCKTEILSKHANYSGVQFNNATKVSSCDQAQESTIVQTNFASYLEKRLTKIPNCISKVKPTTGETGLNFMEALDEEESDPKKFTPKVGFYDNKPEDRFFVGRKTEYGDTDLMKGKASYDWDNSDQKDIWVTFGFIVELLNVFFTQKMQMSNNDKPYKFYEIETKDVVIGAHPNLISTDAGVLLIPNSTAPKFNSGFYYPLGDPDNNDYQKQNADVGNCFLSYKKENITAKTFDDKKNDDIFKNVNRPLFKVFRTGKSPGIISKEPIQTEGLAGYFKGIASQIGFGELAEVEKNAGKKIIMGVYRDDLDAIINRFRYRKPQQRKFSFPQWVKEPVSQKNAGYWGYLDDLYINKNLIIECAKNSDTAESFYNDLLNKISNAAGKFWDLAVIEDGDGSGKLKIIDKKFSEYESMQIYQFDVGAANRFIKSINFTAQLSNVAANQVIAGASSTSASFKSPSGTINSNQPLLYPYGDRFNMLPIKCPSNDVNTSGIADNNLEVIRQFQNTPQNSSNSKGSYIMSFKKFEGGTITYVGGNMGGPGPVTPRPVETPGKEVGWNIVNLVLPNEALLLSLINDLDFENNSNIYGGQQPGFTVEMTLQGISGLRTFQLFSLKNLPSPYSQHEIICQIVDVTHKVDSSNWTTTIKAGIRSIRGKKIKITTDGENSFELETVK